VSSIRGGGFNDKSRRVTLVTALLRSTTPTTTALPTWRLENPPELPHSFLSSLFDLDYTFTFDMSPKDGGKPSRLAVVSLA